MTALFIHIVTDGYCTELLHVREHSILALGNAFSLANRSKKEECLRVVLICISALVEANGLFLEPVLNAITEQLPLLWERARDSVSIHSFLLSVLTHLIMKIGYTTIENQHIQMILFPLLDYCTDISVASRATNHLEDELRLWLVLLVSSRLATEAILWSGLEPHLSLKVIQFNAVLLGPEVVATLSTIIPDLLLNLVSHITLDGGYDDEMDGDDRSKEVG